MCVAVGCTVQYEHARQQAIAQVVNEAVAQSEAAVSQKSRPGWAVGVWDNICAELTA